MEFDNATNFDRKSGRSPTIAFCRIGDDRLGAPSFAFFCEGWDTTNLDTNRHVSHLRQEGVKKPHLGISHANGPRVASGGSVRLNALSA
jgi:hypothetical protein